MSRRALFGVMVLTLMTTWGVPPGAPPPTAHAVPAPDPLGDKVRQFRSCLQGSYCPAWRVFKGPWATRMWRRLQKRMAGIKVLSVLEKTWMPTRYRARYRAGLLATARKLQARKFDTRQFRRLGQGQSRARLKPNLHVTLVEVVMQRRGRTKTEHLFMVLWRVGFYHYIAFWDDSRHKLLRFLTTTPVPATKH